MDSKNRTKFTFTFDGVTYPSLAEYCRRNHIPYPTVFKIRKSEDCSTEEAIRIWKEKYGGRLRKCSSLRTIAELYGVSYNSLRCKAKEGVEDFLAKYAANGYIIPDNIQWIDSDWMPTDNNEFPLSLIGTAAQVYKDDKENLLLKFEDVRGISYQMQRQKYKLWLIRVGPMEKVQEQSDFEAEPEEVWLGSWRDRSDGWYLEYALFSQAVRWTDIVRVISMLCRQCQKAGMRKKE